MQERQTLYRENMEMERKWNGPLLFSGKMIQAIST